MEICFDTPISRLGSDATKYDERVSAFGKDDVIPLWIADMDFASPASVVDAVKARADHPLYGYSSLPESLFRSQIDWFRRIHKCVINREWMMAAPGVVPALYSVIKALTAPGDGVIVQTPIYHHFINAPKITGRHVVENPLILDGNQYRIDFEHLEQCAARENTRILLLCSPHNPTGRVWSEKELNKLLIISRKHGLLIIADEIHCDLVNPDQSQQMILNTAKITDRFVTLLSPSKTFNLGGMSISTIIAPNQQDRAKIDHEAKRSGISVGSPFCIRAFTSAYNHGEQWRSLLIDYLHQNKKLVYERLAPFHKKIVPVCSDGTFLMWLDCRNIGYESRMLADFFVNSCGVGLSPGDSFGYIGEGFMRMNVAVPKSILERALDQIETQIKRL